MQVILLQVSSFTNRSWPYLQMFCSLNIVKAMIWPFVLIFSQTKRQTWRKLQIPLRYKRVHVTHFLVWGIFHSRCFREGSSGEYVDLRITQQEDGEYCTGLVRSFAICTLHQTLFGWSNLGWWYERVCRLHGSMRNAYQILIGKHEG
jgi:hypothetical protein